MSEQFQRFASKVNAKPNTEEENNALFDAHLHGDKQAYERLVLGNQALIFKIAHQMPKLVDIEDLVQCGNIGLMNGIADYGKKCNTYNFGTLAGLWIREAMRKALEKSRIVHTNKWYRMNAEERGAYVVHESLNEKIGDGESEFADSLADDRNTPHEETTQNDNVSALLKALESLDDREQRIIRAHTGMGCERITLEEIAKKLNLTHERVRQIEVLAMKKLKKALED